MSIKKSEAKGLKPGSYFLIDGEPCKVVSIEKSKPGKHGAAKANIVAIGFFDNRKRNVIMPADRMVDVPVIEKTSATVIADMGETYSLMDSETFVTYEVPKPTDDDIASKIELNVAVEVWDVMGTKVITRVKT
ncbi:MAG: translation initiation factor IF-5A [Candidatus Thorarchaeota archaeon SMTZ-45]|nr:MAG: translation initiation factor IF-5A [Candidatus Thorarchaeota archaeon SMTZ1-45]KXH75720.1 MAG: translation initiation factor IF-5A [Candidatus Thorarchaeota archaeon SMTZ-45]